MAMTTSGNPTEIQFKGKSINTGEWKYGYYFYSSSWQRHVIVTTKDGQDIFTIVEPESVEMVNNKKELVETLN